MKTLNQVIYEYGELVKSGDIKRAYLGIINFMKDFRQNLKKSHPEFSISGDIYQGYMDINFFSMEPEFLRNMDLKVIIAFVHSKTEFEIWLSSNNQKVLDRFKKQLKDQDLGEYSLCQDLSTSSLIEKSLVENPDFDKADKLKEELTNKIIEFIKDMEDILIDL